MVFEGTKGGLYTGLALIAWIRRIKPCISALVGDQFF